MLNIVRFKCFLSFKARGEKRERGDRRQEERRDRRREETGKERRRQD